MPCECLCLHDYNQSVTYSKLTFLLLLCSGVTANPMYSIASSSRQLSDNPGYDTSSVAVGNSDTLVVRTGDGGYELMPADKGRIEEQPDGETTLNRIVQNGSVYHGFNRWNTETGAGNGKLIVLLWLRIQVMNGL